VFFFFKDPSVLMVQMYAQVQSWLSLPTVACQKAKGNKQFRTLVGHLPGAQLLSNIFPRADWMHCWKTRYGKDEKRLSL